MIIIIYILYYTHIIIYIKAYLIHKKYYCKIVKYPSIILLKFSVNIGVIFGKKN